MLPKLQVDIFFSKMSDPVLYQRYHPAPGAATLRVFSRILTDVSIETTRCC